MFKQAFQGCPFIMLLEAKGAQPLQNWDVKKANAVRMYNKDIKSYVIDITGQSNQAAKMPNTDISLGITQQYLAFQMFLPKDQAFSFVITVENAQKQKYRLQFSTAVKQVKVTPPHVRIPLHMIAGAWSTLVMDLFECMRMFKSDFSQIHTIEISPHCTILRIFSLLSCPLPSIELYSELDMLDLQKNPRLPKPPFSKRQHQPLDPKLTAIPMHIQVVDDFYLSLFNEQRKNDDVCLRNTQQIIEARRMFLENFNQYDQYEINGTKISNTDNLMVNQAVPSSNIDPIQIQFKQQQHIQTQQPHQIQETVESIEGEQSSKSSSAQNSQKRKPAVKTLQQKKVTGSIQATLNQIKKQQEEAEQTKNMIDTQKQKISVQVKNVNMNEETVLEQKPQIQAKQSQQMNVPRPPKVMQEIQNEEYCAEGVDLTVNAIPVVMNVQNNCQQSKKTEVNDRRALTPVKRVKGQEVQSMTKNIPNPIKSEKSEKEDLNENEEGDIVIAGNELIQNDDQQQEWEQEQEGGNQNEDEQQLDEEALLNQQQVGQQNQKGNKMNSTAQHLDLPEPGQQQIDQGIPDPANQNVLNDPVAFGLEYDPETGCYYEK